MKLVIEIPESMYNRSKKPPILSELERAVANGTPLNEIRAKIAAKIGGNGSENDGLDKALAIIDEYIREGKDCTDCILDGTDACPRGAGRAVDAEVCEDFIGESEGENDT